VIKALKKTACGQRVRNWYRQFEWYKRLKMFKFKKKMSAAGLLTTADTALPSPNLRGAMLYPPGHYYSPLLDIQTIAAAGGNPKYDGVEFWEHIDLKADAQRRYYEDLLNRFSIFDFPKAKNGEFRYFWPNDWFPLSDAFTLSGIIRREKPQRIVEVGSGFSSAAILDTLDRANSPAQVTFVEPYPDRLHSLLSEDDRKKVKILTCSVQDVPLEIFEQLGENDILFIDSSHVAKIGSDIAFIFLRILPRLKKGVIVHFHDIFFPNSYPLNWVLEGRAWNESLFLRAFLACNSQFAMLAFNSFAGCSFPEIFSRAFPDFLANTGGSIWLKKIA
jgi:hypothetical protein